MASATGECNWHGRSQLPGQWMLRTAGGGKEQTSLTPCHKTSWTPRPTDRPPCRTTPRERLSLMSHGDYVN